MNTRGEKSTKSTVDDTVYLDRNENLYGPAPACLNVVRIITPNELSVYSRDFVRGVKSALSERLAHDLNIPESQVLLGDGSEDLLKQAVHCYLGPGDTLLCPALSWWYYRALASEVGGKTATYSLRQGADEFSYDMENLALLLRKVSPKILLIASPNNPTGNSFPTHKLKHLLDAFRDGIVILDEAYWGFADSTDEQISMVAGEYQNLIVLRTFSKYYALAGARIGYAVVGKGLDTLVKFAARYLGHNRISENLALAALDSVEYYAKIRADMQQDRERLYRFFEKLQGFTAFRSDANFILARLPEGVQHELQQFLNLRKIRVKYFTEPELRDFVRITIGRREHNDALMKALNEFVPGRGRGTLG